MSEPITSRQAAEVAGTTVTTINRWVAAGRLTPVLEVPGYNGARLFDPADVLALRSERTS
jgi:DNA-binding transcriptional MerR regulator